MATSTTASIADPLGNTLYTLTETSTKPSQVALDTTSGVIHAVEIDNTAGSVAVYLHIWDLASGSVTIGTTDEDFTFMAPAASRVTYACPEGAAYGTALTAALVSAPGGSVGPSAAVTVYILVET
jgi:hypothetical protein